MQPDLTTHIRNALESIDLQHWKLIFGGCSMDAERVVDGRHIPFISTAPTLLSDSLKRIEELEERARREWKRSRKAYDSGYHTVRVELKRADLMGLIAGGAPPDEYDCEAVDIAEGMHRVANANELTALIREVFERYFSPGFKPNEDDEKVARDIWESLQQKD